jgi:hypothetical protein
MIYHFGKGVLTIMVSTHPGESRRVAESKTQGRYTCHESLAATLERPTRASPEGAEVSYDETPKVGSWPSPILRSGSKLIDIPVHIHLAPSGSTSTPSHNVEPAVPQQTQYAQRPCTFSNFSLPKMAYFAFRCSLSRIYSQNRHLGPGGIGEASSMVSRAPVNFLDSWQPQVSKCARAWPDTTLYFLLSYRNLIISNEFLTQARENPNAYTTLTHSVSNSTASLRSQRHSRKPRAFRYCLTHSCRIFKLSGEQRCWRPGQSPAFRYDQVVEPGRIGNHFDLPDMRWVFSRYTMNLVYRDP